MSDAENIQRELIGLKSLLHSENRGPMSANNDELTIFQ